jgi:phospholipase/carboxylesterase
MLGQQARDLLRQHGYHPTWKEYRMPHSVCLEEIVDIGNWLRPRLATQP